MDHWLKSLQSKATDILVTDIDGVLRELGFVGYDPVAGAPIYKSPEWQRNSALAVSYTLPALLLPNDQMKEKKKKKKEVPPLVQVKFQTVGDFLLISGALARDGSDLHKLYYHKTRTFASVIEHGNITEFLRKIKDELCFPLLIDITEAAGLRVPNCFSTLPSELKVGIMAMLPAESVARLECVCASLRSLSSSNDRLWEAKFSEVYGKDPAATAAAGWSSSSVAEKNWRKRFAKKRKLVIGGNEEVKKKPKIHAQQPDWIPRNPFGNDCDILESSERIAIHLLGNPGAI